MKLRLFLIIWIVFVLTASSSAVIFSELLRTERLRNLDSQVESLSALILNSDVIGEGIAELKEADDIIQEIIGTYRLGLVIVLKNKSSRIIYRNKNAAALDLNPSTKLEWQFVQNKDDIIRIHTSSRGNKILQLGLVADSEVLRPNFWSFLISWYSLALLFVSGVLAYILTIILLKPLRNLSEFLNELTRHIGSELRSQIRLPKLLNVGSSNFMGRFDELHALTRSLNQFLDHLEASLAIHGNQAALLAHEINTPLTVALNRLSQLRKISNDEQKHQISEVENSLIRLSDFVKRYLQLAEAIHQPLSSTSLFAVRLEEFLPQLIERLRSLDGGSRIELKLEDQLRVFSNLSDLEQIISNLIRNALKYSPEEKNVEVIFKNHSLMIRDYGPGIPDEVIRRMGEAFNKSKFGGSGLGLAWVSALCRKYNWTLEFKKEEPGTLVTIHFPQDSGF